MKFLTNTSARIKKYFFVLEQNEVLRREIDFLQKNVLELLLKDLEGLEQDKFYICSIPKASPEELERIKQYVFRASQDMKWSGPNILFLNTELKINKLECGSKDNFEKIGGVKNVQVRVKPKVCKNAHKNGQRNKKH